jgi:hypothetical protein
MHLLPEEELRSSKRVLDPVERSSEILFGLIMVLTFTSSMRAATSGRAEVRAMIIGALGCNLAWGLIDAIMYLMAALSEKGHRFAMLQALHAAGTASARRELIRGALGPVIAETLQPPHYEAIQESLLKLPYSHLRPRLQRKDWLGAAGVFLLVFLSTLPVVVPFLLIADVHNALRVSNGIAIVMLALTGYSYGYYARQSAWLWSLSMVVLGCVMVAITIRLGG